MILEPALFDHHPGIQSAFSTRIGGVSEGPYWSLNLGLSTGDEEANVQNNRQRFCERVGVSTDQLALAGQVHGSSVKQVSTPGLFPGVDGLVTTERDILLAITAADCAAVLMADDTTGVAGACHAGWRGVAGGVVVSTIRMMEHVGADITRIKAYISPCITVDHFEVGQEVAEKFDADVVVDWPNEQRPHVDLKAAIAKQLRLTGIVPENFAISPYCTYADNDRFFSYRAQEGICGRMLGIIGFRGKGER
jgi:YfiH family protein